MNDISYTINGDILWQMQRKISKVVAANAKL